MKWILILFLALPVVSANCGNISMEKNGNYVFLNISQPVEYWVEDIYHDIIIPKTILTHSQKLRLRPSKNTPIYLKARPLHCQNITQLIIQPAQEKTPYFSPNKKLFKAIPFLFFLIIALFLKTKP